MDHTLREALNIGLTRRSAKLQQKSYDDVILDRAVKREQGIADLFIRRTISTANMNTLNTAIHDSRKGGRIGLADYQTGLIQIPPNISQVMRNLETDVPREEIVDTLLKGSQLDSSQWVSDEKFYNPGAWFISGETNNARLGSFDKALENNREISMETHLPDGRVVRGIKMGNQVMFRVPI